MTNEARTTSARKLPQYVAALSATGGALAAGTLLGWTSPTENMILNQNNEADFVNQYGFDMDDETWSWVGSAAGLGAASMCLVIGTIINLIGRKLTMLLLVLPFVAGWVLVTWATSIPMLIVGRALLGIAGGAFCVTAPTYTGEIAQKEIRGTLGSYFQLMITIGILFVYAVGAANDLFALNIICLIIPMVFGIIFVFMPETPLYLVSKERKEDAIRSLKWLRGSQYDYDSELTELIDEHNERVAQKISFIGAFKRRSTVMGMIIIMGLMFFQQMSGINAVIFYTGFIFTAANTGIHSTTATIIVGVIQVIATFIASMVVDKVGRRIMLLVSVAVMGICTILMGVYFYLDARPDPITHESQTASLGWLPIVSLSVFICMFSIGFGPIPWLMVGELFAPDVKGLAASIAGAFNWLLAFVITKTFSDLRGAIGIGETFWLFSGFSILGTIFVFFVVPETKGKSLTEIQKMLAGEKLIDNSDNGVITEAKL